MKNTDIKQLKQIANDIRIDIIEQVYNAKSGHPGGALSIAEILTVLYFNQMNIDPKKPDSNLRDRLVLSKGHASAALYAVLAERGYLELLYGEKGNKVVNYNVYGNKIFFQE